MPVLFNLTSPRFDLTNAPLGTEEKPQESGRQIWMMFIEYNQKEKL